ncbi:MAG: heavy-metal-associated domain-containing protein [Clostridiales bacterium]|nr:heavy-metal-associated domain-containing protein [Clostridiales bacterium]
MKKTITITGMHCQHCVMRVEKALGELGSDVKVDLKAGVATVETNAADADVKNAVEDLGFDVVSIA